MALAKHHGDWAAVKSDYNQGVPSLRSISLKHNVPRSSIADRAKAEGWERPSNTIIRTGMDGRTKPILPEGDELSPASLAQYCLHGLAQLVEGGLSLLDYKILSDCLASLHKILITSSPVQEQRLSYLSPELISVMTGQEQDIVQKILAAAETRLKASAQADEKITLMRKQL